MEYDDLLRLYRKRVGRDVDEDIVVGTLVWNMPKSELKTHIMLSLAKLEKWEDVKLEIDNFRRAGLNSTSTSSGYPSGNTGVNTFVEQLSVLGYAVKGKGKTGRDGG